MTYYVDTKTKEVYSTKSQVIEACKDDLTFSEILDEARGRGWTEDKFREYFWEGLKKSGSRIPDYYLLRYMETNIVPIEIEGSIDSLKVIEI